MSETLEPNGAVVDLVEFDDLEALYNDVKAVRNTLRACMAVNYEMERRVTELMGRLAF